MSYKHKGNRRLNFGNKLSASSIIVQIPPPNNPEYVGRESDQPQSDHEKVVSASKKTFDAVLDSKFAAIRDEVAAAKNLLDEIPPEEFHQFMRNFDLLFDLKKRVKADYNMAVSTNASLKMYEILGSMRVCKDLIRVFCDAELPGAFIVAINHYVRTRCPPSASFDWVASSYDPDTEGGKEHTVLEDKYGIYAGHRNRWLQGPRPNALPPGEEPVTGDVTDPDVVVVLADAVHARFPPTADVGSGASLYTSDAGTDVSDNFNEQESKTALINFGQVLAGVASLAVGGNLVTKQYTFFSIFNRSLIAALAGMFEEFYVMKPQTSRPANSEVYLVGKGFRGAPDGAVEHWLDLLAGYRASETSPAEGPPLIAPESFAASDAAMLHATTIIHKIQQVAFLKEASGIYRQIKGASTGAPDFRQLGWSLSQTSKDAQNQWIINNPIKPILAEYQLVDAPKAAYN